MTSRAAAFILALSFAAPPVLARGVSQSFRVGAVVVRSASVTATAIGVRTGLTARNGIRVEQVASRGTPPPMIQVGSTLKPMRDTTELQIAATASRDVTVTIVY